MATVIPSIAEDIEGRLWKRAARSTPDACWPWIGARLPAGYGRMHLGGRGGKWVYVHRISFELAHGPIPRGMVVRHSCDNPPCINPAHLSIGTQLDNVHDRESRGRNRYARLTSAGAQ